MHWLEVALIKPLNLMLTSVQGFADYKAPSHEISYYHKNSKERGQAPLPHYALSPGNTILHCLDLTSFWPGVPP